MSHVTDDEEASLAFARSLQAEYDQLAFASPTQDESPIEAEYRAAAQLRKNPGSRFNVSSSSGWKDRMNNGKYSERREAEVDANNSPTSAKDFTVQRQIQEDQFHSPLVPFPDPSAALPSLSDDSKGIRRSFVPFTPGVFRGPPSPPVSPLKYQNPSASNPPPYSFHASGHLPQPPQFFPPSPQEEVPNGSVNAIYGPIDGSVNFVPHVPQSSRADSPTVVLYRTRLTYRTMTNYWQDCYKKSMKEWIPVFTPLMKNMPKNCKRNLTRKTLYINFNSLPN